MSMKPTRTAAGNGDAPQRADMVHPLRPISFGQTSVSIDRRDDGTIYLRPKLALGDYPVRITDRLHHWVKSAPDRIFMAEREAGGGWPRISYAQSLAASRRIPPAPPAAAVTPRKPVLSLA